MKTKEQQDYSSRKEREFFFFFFFCGEEKRGSVVIKIGELFIKKKGVSRVIGGMRVDF